MPELPEVETVKNTLIKNVLHKEIKDVKVFVPKIVRNMSPAEFKSSLIGQRIKDIKRRGKYLIFILDGYILVSHLRMEGKYNLMTSEDITKHEHIIFEFTDGYSLRYDDVRKFGTMDLVPKMSLKELYKLPIFARVAEDIFDPDFDFETFYKKLTKSNRAIKTSLLDQSIISGIGNIYVDEILFRTRLHPLKPSNTITMEVGKEIAKNTKIVLERAIELGGSTIKTFTSSHSISGRFQNELLIHTKDYCPVCKAKVTKIKVGGRTSYVCLNCQKID